MAYKLSNRSINNLDGVNAKIIGTIIEGIKDSPFDFGIPNGGGLRTDQDQLDMYAIGRTVDLHREPVTWTLDSYHKTGKAFDIYAYVNGKASWDNKYLEPIARHLIKIAKQKFNLELHWGFDLWGKDGAHFQVGV